MNLYELLQRRAAESGPIRIGVLGAGKFSSMFLTQASVTPELHLVGIADLSVEKARGALARTGWSPDRFQASSIEQALRTGGTFVTDDSESLIRDPQIEVILEITGNPVVGTRHALSCFEHGKHVIMVNVEADCMVGPVLQRRAEAAGVVYSMAYGDQPALISELVDWCRTVGFDVVAAGKGTKYLPEYHYSTPDTVWDHYGFTEEQLRSGDYNPQMFNSFLDGTKSAIEAAAVSNATGLVPQPEGLHFPPAGVDDLPTVLRERELGGSLTRRGTVEIVSSLNRDASEVYRDLRWGVYVTFEARTEYAVQCFAEYGVKTDPTGRYGTLYRPYHMIGLELAVSIASAVLRGEPTGHPKAFLGDVVSVAKRDLRAGEHLDGEGGFTVYGKLAPAQSSLEVGALPIGLAHGAVLANDVKRDSVVRWEDIRLDESLQAVVVRKTLETEFRSSFARG